MLRHWPRLLRWQITILIVMYVGYAAFMVCRNTLVATSVELINDPSLDIDEASYGRLMSWHSAGAIAGKLVTGPGADLLGGRRMFLIALALTAVANVGFAFCSSFYALAAFNFFGQFAKAGGWPAMTKLVASWYSPSRYGQVWSLISTSSRVGTMTAGLLFGSLLSLVSWRTIFLISAALTAVVFVVLYFLLKDAPRDVGLESATPLTSDSDPPDGAASQSPDEIQDARRLAPPNPVDSLSLGQACVYFALSGRCWFICLSLVFLTIVMDFLNFIPSYLSKSLQLDAGAASMAGSTFPAGMLVALIFTSFVYDRLTKRQLMRTLGGLLLIGCLAVLVLWRLDLAPAGIRAPLAIGTIFTLGFSISPAYYIPMSVFAVAFGGKHSGFLVALIDVFGYCGALVFNYFGGSIALLYGWTVFLSGLLTIAILATLCMVTFLGLDWRAESMRNRATS